MARFNCTSCLAEGDFAALDGEQRCPQCGSSERVRVFMTMDDYPVGHPFWDELAGRNNRGDDVSGPLPDGKVSS